MAKEYVSEAQLVIDGEETAVYVQFFVYADGGTKRWHGGFGSSDPNLGALAMEARSVVLRMPDGKEGHIVVTRAGGPEEAATFTGSGPAPT